MLWLKSCPRCITGTLSEHSDIYGTYIVCLHCGFYPLERPTTPKQGVQQNVIEYPADQKTKASSHISLVQTESL